VSLKNGAARQKALDWNAFRGAKNERRDFGSSFPQKSLREKTKNFLGVCGERRWLVRREQALDPNATTKFCWL
jgi:hypothetical protein